MSDHLDSLFPQEQPTVETTETTEQEVEQQAEPIEEPKQEEAKEKIEKVVPYGAMHEERMRRKELQSELKALSERNQKMEERFQQVLEKMNQPQVDDSDPIDVLQSEINQLKSKLQNYEMTEQERTSLQQQQKTYTDLQSKYMSSASAYVKENPKFTEAYQYWISNRAKELNEAGYSINEANQIITQEELNIANKSYQDEVNPAERIFKLAVARGYKDSKDPALEKLEKIEQASKTLSGSGEESNLSLEALAEMSNEDFDKNWDKLMNPNRVF